jgi:outer membrane protein TolC
MKYIFLIAFLFLSLIGFSQESEVYKLSLKEAIERALDSSYVSLNARRDQVKALKQKWEATADGLPQIDANARYENSPQLRVSPLPPEFSGTGQTEFLAFGLQQNMSASATLNQLIFDGSYIVALKAAKTFLEYSENANEKTRLQVRQKVIKTYANGLLVEENVKVLTKNRETVKESLDETQKIYENGLAEQEEVEQLQITYQQLTNTLRNSERNLELSKQTLNMVLALPVDQEIELTDDLESLAMEQMADFEILNQDIDLTQNVDYKIAENLVKQRDIEVQLEKSRGMPRLSAFANYGTVAFDDDFVFFDNSTQWFAFSTFGVSLDIPIFSSLKRSKRTQRAEITLLQAKSDFQQSVEQIKLDFSRAKSDYRFALENYQTQLANLDLAERIEQKNIVKYKEGIGSSFDLRQAQLQLYNAQNAFLQSMLELINSKTSLETVLNTVDVN